ncbi:PH domain-containing protein [Candidatus Dojkabacteria bacterium]|nr:PH domain-containing protein [Candidatus Dojkabacteria bacterium]
MKPLIRCRPSQKKHLVKYIMSLLLLIVDGILVFVFKEYEAITLIIGLLSALIIIFRAYYTFLYTKNFIIEITEHSVEFRHGVFKRRLESVEMHRIQDYTKDHSFIESILGISNIVILSTDKTTPILKLEGLTKEDAEKIFDILQYHASDSLVKHYIKSNGNKTDKKLINAEKRDRQQKLKNP